MKPTFEYCAARFLDHWVRSEDPLYQALVTPTPTPSAIRAGLSYFKVSRGFARINEDPSVASTIQRLLLRHSQRVTVRTSVQRVEALASAFQTELKLDNLVSAASKLLWLRCRSPIVIYDSRAIRALKVEHTSLKPGDYSSYYVAWHEAFADHQTEIASATRSLATIVKFTAASSRPKSALARLAANRWFQERVFDQYLWIVGEPRRKVGQAQTYDA